MYIEPQKRSGSTSLVWPVEIKIGHMIPPPSMRSRGKRAFETAAVDMSCVHVATTVGSMGCVHVAAAAAPVRYEASLWEGFRSKVL